MRRRYVVNRIGIALFLGFAGCLKSGDNGTSDGEITNASAPKADNEMEGQTPETTSATAGDELQSDETRPPISADPRDILIKNYDGAPYTVSITLNRGGSSLLDRTYEVDPVSSENVVRIEDVFDEVGTHSLSVSIVGGNQTATSEWDVTDMSSNAVLYISESGTLSIRADQSM